MIDFLKSIVFKTTTIIQILRRKKKNIRRHFVYNFNWVLLSCYVKH